MDMKDNVERAVSNALDKETDFELPPAFADNVVAMVGQKVAAKEARRDRWWLIIGIVSMVATCLYASAAVDFAPEVGTFFSGYRGLIIFGCFFVAALHLVDKFILSKNRVER